MRRIIRQSRPLSLQGLFDVFHKKRLRTMPPHCEFDHEIHIENDQTPHSHIYPLSGHRARSPLRIPRRHAQQGFIRSSQSPAVPSSLCEEEGGTLQLCVGLPEPSTRLLKKDRYLIPLVTNLLDQQAA